jgi:3-methyladenine DNA glycosylase AlkC
MPAATNLLDQRKPARRMAEIPGDVLAALNCGETDSRNLVEWLACDQGKLAAAVFPTVGLDKHIAAARAAVDALAKPTAMQQTRSIGLVLAEHVDVRTSPRSAFQRLLAHRSDIVRSWLAFVVGVRSELSLDQRLSAIRPLAADPHFGVREIAWMGVRPAIEQELLPAIETLAGWSLDPHDEIRRFASEATRPCGVWCNHLTALKAEPELALPILEPLASDPAKYVRDSVGNWLNDASKSQPAWVEKVCSRWQKQSRTSETAYIVGRALRTLRKVAK